MDALCYPPRRISIASSGSADVQMKCEAPKRPVKAPAKLREEHGGRAGGLREQSQPPPLRRQLPAGCMQLWRSGKVRSVGGCGHQRRGRRRRRSRRSRPPRVSSRERKLRLEDRGHRATQYNSDFRWAGPPRALLAVRSKGFTGRVVDLPCVALVQGHVGPSRLSERGSEGASMPLHNTEGTCQDHLPASLSQIVGAVPRERLQSCAFRAIDWS